MQMQQQVQILRLALALRGSTVGLTLQDIQQMFDVTERTAHRLRDAVARLFPALEAVDREDRRRYWRLPPGHAERLVEFTADELAAFESAQRILAALGYDEATAPLRDLGLKLRALLPPQAGRRLEPDIEAVLEAESIAVRPGPRPRRSPEVLAQLRQAIKAGCCLRIRYRHRGRDSASDVLLHPYGILLGSRHYLVAHKPPEPGNGPAGGPFLRMYAIPEIEAATVLTDRPFVRDPDVSLQAFADRAFGIFQEAPRRVVWRFSGPAVRDARQFLFHPSQEMAELPDGRLEVRFTAGGLREMCWHLFTWGRHVEVVEPEELRALYARSLAEGGAPPPERGTDGSDGGRTGQTAREPLQPDLFDLLA